MVCFCQEALLAGIRRCSFAEGRATSFGCSWDPYSGWLGDGPLRRGPGSLTCGRVQGPGRTKHPWQEHAPCRLAVCISCPGFLWHCLNNRPRLVMVTQQIHECFQGQACLGEAGAAGAWRCVEWGLGTASSCSSLLCRIIWGVRCCGITLDLWHRCQWFESGWDQWWSTLFLK